ncbi:hypothetical protein NDU88_004175 [Pleurodeles waltl]|uniref:Uncharacterized protein n=1 Tax=Pleurodeles waltl TaxID=8319 RepID=A0AAV7WR79_PLEWA|nr:hypothetical protein NDU88_004175 [Pleurodeles waltl]
MRIAPAVTASDVQPMVETSRWVAWALCTELLAANWEVCISGLRLLWWWRGRGLGPPGSSHVSSVRQRAEAHLRGGRQRQCGLRELCTAAADRGLRVAYFEAGAALVWSPPEGRRRCWSYILLTTTCEVCDMGLPTDKK